MSKKSHLFLQETEGFFTEAASPDVTPVTITTTGLTNCSTIMNLVQGKTKTDLLSYLQLNEIEQNFNRIIQFLNAVPNKLADVTTVQNYSNISRFMETFNTTQKPFLETVVNCMKDKQDNESINSWNQQKEKTTESKLRLDSLKSPEQNVSYYEGWFPLFRPMKEVTLFALFGTALAVILFSIVFFLSLSGVTFSIVLPGGGDGFELPKGYMYGGLATGAAFTGLAIYKGWF